MKLKLKKPSFRYFNLRLYEKILLAAGILITVLLIFLPVTDAGILISSVAIPLILVANGVIRFPDSKRTATLFLSMAVILFFIASLHM